MVVGMRQNIVVLNIAMQNTDKPYFASLRCIMILSLFFINQINKVENQNSNTKTKGLVKSGSKY